MKHRRSGGRSLRTNLIASAALASTAIVDPALAAENAEPTLEEILVTARKREESLQESLQETPIAISPSPLMRSNGNRSHRRRISTRSHPICSSQVMAH